MHDTGVKLAIVSGTWHCALFTMRWIHSDVLEDCPNITKCTRWRQMTTNADSLELGGILSFQPLATNLYRPSMISLASHSWPASILSPWPNLGRQTNRFFTYNHLASYSSLSKLSSITCLTPPQSYSIAAHFPSAWASIGDMYLDVTPFGESPCILNIESKWLLISGQLLAWRSWNAMHVSRGRCPKEGNQVCESFLPQF